MSAKTEALKRLSDGLEQAFAGRPRQLAWGDPAAMRRSLEAVRMALGNRRGMTREARIVQSVLAFRVQRGKVDFVRLKYACYGLADPVDWESRRLLEDDRLLQNLLQQVRALSGDPHRFAACQRGLTHALKTLQDITPRPPALERNMAVLEGFLARF